MRENEIEQNLKDRVKEHGGRSYKWVSPGLNGVPDQIVLMPVPPAHQRLVARYIRFVECKAPGEEVRGQQELRHRELRDLGFRVDIVDTIEGGDLLAASMG